MIKFIGIVVMVLCFGNLAGCKKADQVTGAQTPPAPTPVTREERKAAAIDGVKTATVANGDQKTRVDLSSLAGRKLGDLYASYLGLPNGQLVPAFVDVSFETQMSRMYQKKVNFERCKKKNKSICTEASDTVLAKAPELYKRYLDGDKKKMDLKEFISVADKKVSSAKASLDWVLVCKHYKLDQKKCSLLKSIVSKLQGKDMVAYGMTELLPSADGKLNVAYMDVILKNAGAEFLYFVPALGDGLASVGFYQFTMFALRHDDEATEGASVINKLVKPGGEKIHDSVVYLEGHEHHVAAFYFSVHNLARLVSKLSVQGVKKLSTVHQNYQDEMVMYVAAAHHAPSLATTRTAKWVNRGLKSDLHAAYRGSRIHAYAGKTKANLLAVYKKV